MELMEHMEHMEHGTMAARFSAPLQIPNLVHFGKYKHWPIAEACEDEKWLDWLLENPYVLLGIALADQSRVRERLQTEEVM